MLSSQAVSAHLKLLSLRDQAQVKSVSISILPNHGHLIKRQWRGDTELDYHTRRVNPAFDKKDVNDDIDWTSKEEKKENEGLNIWRKPLEIPQDSYSNWNPENINRKCKNKRSNEFTQPPVNDGSLVAEVGQAFYKNQSMENSRLSSIEATKTLLFWRKNIINEISVHSWNPKSQTLIFFRSTWGFQKLWNNSVQCVHLRYGLRLNKDDGCESRKEPKEVNQHNLTEIVDQNESRHLKTISGDFNRLVKLRGGLKSLEKSFLNENVNNKISLFQNRIKEYSREKPINLSFSSKLDGFFNDINSIELNQSDMAAFFRFNERPLKINRYRFRDEDMQKQAEKEYQQRFASLPEKSAKELFESENMKDDIMFAAFLRINFILMKKNHKSRILGGDLKYNFTNTASEIKRTIILSRVNLRYNLGIQNELCKRQLRYKDDLKHRIIDIWTEKYPEEVESLKQHTFQWVWEDSELVEKVRKKDIESYDIINQIKMHEKNVIIERSKLMHEYLIGWIYILAENMIDHCLGTLTGVTSEEESIPISSFGVILNCD